MDCFLIIYRDSWLSLKTTLCLLKNFKNNNSNNNNNSIVFKGVALTPPLGLISKIYEEPKTLDIYKPKKIKLKIGYISKQRILNSTYLN